jgi:hypothetical protein
MSDQSSVISRVVRWAAVGIVICAAIALYFRMGTRLEPLTAATRTGTTAGVAR